MEIDYTFETKDGDDQFTYEVDYSDVDNFIDKKLKTSSKEELLEVISNLDIPERLRDVFENDIYEHFKDNAYSLYKDGLEYSRDPLGYHGLSQRDFI